MTSVYMKCVFYHKLRCPGRAIYRFGGTFRHTQAHNHPPDPDYVGERHFRANVLAQCENARFVSFKDILDHARQDRRYSRRVRANMTMRRLRSSMYSARNKSFPAIPQTLRDLTRILLQPCYRHISSTVDGQGNLYSGSTTATDGSHHVVFISHRMRQQMAEVKILQLDGTFKSRPATPPTSQCYVLVTPWRDTIVPLGWVLMEKRTLPAYRAVINMLKQLCPMLNPDIIISDWEYSQQVAWSEAFPNAQIQGCLWHLCRAFVKKASKLGILRYKRQLPDVLDYLRMSCAIALLPVAHFRRALHILRADAMEEDIRIAYLFHNFFNYVENRWIHNIPRRLWMSFYNCRYRTNNICESHNRMLRNAVGAYRPNVYAFIAALARLEHNADLDIDLLKRGGMPKRSRKWQSAFADRQLQALSNDLEMDIFHDRDESIRRFLHRASHVLQNAFNDHIEREGGRN